MKDNPDGLLGLWMVVLLIGVIAAAVLTLLIFSIF